MKTGGYWQLTMNKCISLLCDLGYVNEKISRTFIERLLAETLPDVVGHVNGHVLNIEACYSKD